MDAVNMRATHAREDDVGPASGIRSTKSVPCDVASDEKPPRSGRGVQWSFLEVRRLLRKAYLPAELAEDPLAQRLRQLLGTTSAAKALKFVVDRALAEYPVVCRTIVQRVDFEGAKSAVVASEVAARDNISVRSFFRYRARAINAIRFEIQQLTSEGDSHPRVASTVDLSALIERGCQLPDQGTPAALEAALASLEVAAALDPRSADARTAIAMTHILLGQSMLKDLASETLRSIETAGPVRANAR